MGNSVVISLTSLNKSALKRLSNFVCMFKFWICLKSDFSYGSGDTDFKNFNQTAGL